MAKSDPERGERPERVQITVAELLGRRPRGSGGRARHSASAPPRNASRRGLAVAAGSVIAAGTVAAAATFAPALRLGPASGVPTAANEPGSESPGGRVSELPEPGQPRPPAEPQPLPGEHDLLMIPPPPSGGRVPSAPEPERSGPRGDGEGSEQAEAGREEPSARPEAGRSGGSDSSPAVSGDTAREGAGARRAELGGAVDTGPSPLAAAPDTLLDTSSSLLAAAPDALLDTSADALPEVAVGVAAMCGADAAVPALSRLTAPIEPTGARCGEGWEGFSPRS